MKVDYQRQANGKAPARSSQSCPIYSFDPAPQQLTPLRGARAQAEHPLQMSAQRSQANSNNALTSLGSSQTCITSHSCQHQLSSFTRWTWTFGQVPSGAFLLTTSHSRTLRLPQSSTDAASRFCILRATMAAPRVWQSKQKGGSSTADADTCRRKARMINWD